MKEKQSQGRNPKARRKPVVRASITFPPALYTTLEEIAQEKKVSLAWVVRDASARYVTERSAEATRPGKG
jgi:metal-responsive CopG/Arc/MetJ family transcriptional regulator